jgi:serine/threonine-protein kinase HipA
MMLTVWLTLSASEVVKVGELAIDDPDARGTLEGQFRYTPEYLENPNVAQ